MNTEPKELNAIEVTAETPEDIQRILKTYGVAVIRIPCDKPDLKAVLNQTSFYNTANAVFKDEHRVEEPTMDEKINPSTYKKRKAGDDAQGMLHQYATPVHIFIQQNPIFRKAMKTIYGETVRFVPNRLRKCVKFKNDANSLHIEAHELFEEDADGQISLVTGDVATIVGLTGVRRFCFWDMNNADLNALRNFHRDQGSKEFTSLPATFMNEHYNGRRRMINIDCSEQPHLIIWRESIPHEIAHSPSLSLFISPVSEFSRKRVKTVTSYQPIEFVGLSYHETNLLGICYNMNGFEWPSGKKCYQFCHTRAYTHYLPKVREEYRDQNGKFRMRLVHTGQVDQHTEEYQNKLTEMGIVLPPIAFAETTPNFVTDITTYPLQILKDYGFIV